MTCSEFFPHFRHSRLFFQYSMLPLTRLASLLLLVGVRKAAALASSPTVAAPCSDNTRRKSELEAARMNLCEGKLCPPQRRKASENIWRSSSSWRSSA